MPTRLSPRRAVIALVACGAVACGLDVAGTGTDETAGAGGPHPGSGGGPVKLVDASGVSSGSGSGSSSGTTAELDSSVAEPTEDAGAADVHVLDPDATTPEGGDPCDLDEDGYRAVGSCGGTDCCDFDSRAHPGETSYYPSADACGAFDYDCDGKDQGEYGSAGCQLGFFACSGDGFDKTPPACGAAATYDTCQYDLLFCGTVQSSRAQPCR